MSTFIVLGTNYSNGFKATPKPHPCDPSPCGPYSQCKETSGQAVCSCLPNYIGIPPSCRPECIISSECPSNRACKNEKCVDPCPGPCGKNSRCTVVNHNVICTCLNGLTGDPFNNCYEESKFLCLLKENLKINYQLLLLSSRKAKGPSKSMCTFSLWSK